MGDFRVIVPSQVCDRSLSEPSDRPWGNRYITAMTPEGTMLTFYAHLVNRTDHG